MICSVIAQALPKGDLTACKFKRVTCCFVYTYKLQNSSFDILKGIEVQCFWQTLVPPDTPKQAHIQVGLDQLSYLYFAILVCF